MEMAKVTSKGQITIPISIRRRLSINEGDKLLFIDRPEGVMMVNPDMLGSSPETEITTATESAAAAAAVATTPTAASTTVPEEVAEKPQTPQPPKVDAPTVQDKPPEIKRPIREGAAKRDAATVGNLNLDSLLDEIRSIGRKI